MGLGEHLRLLVGKIDRDDRSYVVQDDPECRIEGIPHIGNGEEEVQLTSENHAMYMGKMPKRRGIFRRIANVMGWTEDRQTYSDDFLQGALQFLTDNLAEGETAKFVVGYRLSPYCNGRESMAGYMEFDEQVAALKAMAKKHFGMSEDNLEVIDVADEHPELFAALERAANEETGQVDLEKVFEGVRPVTDVPDEEQPNALEFAYCLYEVQKSSRPFRNKLLSCTTEKQKEVKKAQGLPEKEMTAVDSYALFEVAICLADLLRGRSYKIGTDREKVYDKILLEIMTMNRKVYRQSSLLTALCKRINGAQFQSVFIDRDKNTFTRLKNRRHARTRTSAYTAVAGATALGIAAYAYDMGVRNEAARQAEIESLITSQLEGVHFGGAMPSDYLSEDKNYEHFQLVVDKCMKELVYRYQFDEKTLTYIKPILEEDLLALPNYLGSFFRDRGQIIDFVDEFVLDHRVVLLELGESIERPYAHFQPYESLFDVSVQTEFTHCEKTMDPMKVMNPGTPNDPNPDVDFIGTFSYATDSSYGIGGEFDVYSYRPDCDPRTKRGCTSFDKILLLGSDTKEGCMSTKGMEEFVGRYALTQFRWDFIPYREIERDLSLFHKYDDRFTSAFHSPEEPVVKFNLEESDLMEECRAYFEPWASPDEPILLRRDPDPWQQQGLPTYRASYAAFPGQECYELARASHTLKINETGDEEGDRFIGEYILLARHCQPDYLSEEQKEPFSSDVGRKFASMFLTARYSYWDKPEEVIDQLVPASSSQISASSSDRLPGFVSESQ